MIRWTPPTIGLACVIFLAAACDTDRLIEPPAQTATTTVCHGPAATASAITIPIAELAAHRAHGDFVTSLVVDKLPIGAADSSHFNRITDALAAARAIRVSRSETTTARCEIGITVAAGVYKGNTAASSDPAVERLPLTIDMPRVALTGALKMEVDAAGRALGTSVGGVATTLSPVSPLFLGRPQLGTASDPIIVVDGDPEGMQGNGVSITGFAFESGHVGVDTLPGGQGILGLRVVDLAITGNRFESGFAEAIDLRAVSARIERNHSSGKGATCAICPAGPGEYRITGNRVLGPGGIPGILVTPAIVFPVPATVEQWTPTATASVTVEISNNEVRGRRQVPVGAGVRLTAVGQGVPNVVSTTNAIVRNNTLIGNTFAIIVEAGFPVANTALKGDIHVTLANNVMSQSCQTELLVTLSRHTTALGLQPGPFLRNSSYTIALGGTIEWEDVWFNHPAGFGNTLTVDGQVIANGARAAYDAAKVCPPSP